MGKAGTLERHLAAIYQAVLDFLEFKVVKASGERATINYMVEREMQGKGTEEPEMPEALGNLNKFNVFKLLPYTGGDMCQPLVYMRELVVAHNAEVEHASIQKMKHARNAGKGSGRS